MKLFAVLKKVLFLEIFVMVIFTVITFFISAFFVEPIRLMRYEWTEGCDIDYYSLKKIEDFSLEDYDYITDSFSLENSKLLIESYSSPEYYNDLVENGFNMKREEIHDFDTAVKVSKEVFKEFLPEAREYEKYHVFYDKGEKVWYICGDINPDKCYGYFKIGGSPSLLIRESGEILAVWHSK